MQCRFGWWTKAVMQIRRMNQCKCNTGTIDQARRVQCDSLGIVGENDEPMHAQYRYGWWSNAVLIQTRSINQDRCNADATEKLLNTTDQYRYNAGRYYWFDCNAKMLCMGLPRCVFARLAMFIPRFFTKDWSLSLLFTRSLTFLLPTVLTTSLRKNIPTGFRTCLEDVLALFTLARGSYENSENEPFWRLGFEYNSDNTGSTPGFARS